jgi:glycerol-3-phosphate O-acyltransferase
MTQAIAIPLWFLLVLAILAAWAFWEHLLVPAVRWFFRRRVNEMIQEINTRLKIDIPSFKVTRREVLIDRLFHDPLVQQAAEARASNDPVRRSAAFKQVDQYAREIVPSFNAYVYFRVGYWAAKRLAKFLYRVRLGYADSAGLAAVNPKSTVVFVMNHRSNMDYVLVAFLAAERTALSYAVGEWARVWPLHTLIRSMGAYFVRRNSNDPLYRTVLQRYVQMATQAGVHQAMFPEGRLTIDGKLGAPKLGLLDYMMKGFDPAGERDLVFVPVGINYDRVLEDRTLLRKTDPGAPHRGSIFATLTSIAFLAKHQWLLLTGRWYRFGYACVNFGPPQSMRAYTREQDLDFRALPDEARKQEVEKLGAYLMREMGKVVPVLPVSLVASLFVQHPRQMSELEVKALAHAAMARLETCGAHIYIPRSDRDYAVSVGLRMLTLRHIVHEQEGLFAANAEQLKVLQYYANAIAHLTAAAEPAVVAVAA